MTYHLACILDCALNDDGLAIIYEAQQLLNSGIGERHRVSNRYGHAVYASLLSDCGIQAPAKHRYIDLPALHSKVALRQLLNDQNNTYSPTTFIFKPSKWFDILQHPESYPKDLAELEEFYTLCQAKQVIIKASGACGGSNLFVERGADFDTFCKNLRQALAQDVEAILTMQQGIPIPGKVSLSLIDKDSLLEECMNPDQVNNQEHRTFRVVIVAMFDEQQHIPTTCQFRVVYHTTHQGFDSHDATRQRIDYREARHYTFKLHGIASIKKLSAEVHAEHQRLETSPRLAQQLSEIATLLIREWQQSESKRFMPFNSSPVGRFFHYQAGEKTHQPDNTKEELRRFCQFAITDDAQRNNALTELDQSWEALQQSFTEPLTANDCAKAKLFCRNYLANVLIDILSATTRENLRPLQIALALINDPHYSKVKRLIVNTLYGAERTIDNILLNIDYSQIVKFCNSSHAPTHSCRIL